MVDNLSAESKIQSLLEEAGKYSYPEDIPGIKKRYKDTSLVLFKESQEDAPRNYLTFGSRRSSSVSQYGNTPIVIRRSRSTNGGLAMVAEQVPSLRGRSSRSDYALVEAKEKEEESESDDEYNISQSRSHIDENSILDEDHSVTVDTGSISPSSQIQDLCFDEHHTQGGENKKSFSHYDLHLQHHLEEITEVASNHGEDELGKRNNKTSSDSVSNDPADTKKLSVDINETDIGIAQNVPCSNRKESIEENSPSQRIAIQLFNNNEEELERKRNLVFTESTTADIPDIDHEAVLRDYVHGTSSISILKTQKENVIDTKRKQEEKTQLGSSNGCRYVELKIVEPIDISYNEGTRKEVHSDSMERTLTANDVIKSDDDDDVVFIDANSPPLPRAKFSCSSPTGSIQEASQEHYDVGCSRATVATPPKPRSKSYGESSSNLNEFIKNEDKYPANDNFEDRGISEEQEKSNALHHLPLRCPTPPKKSPMRSPRAPKMKKNKDHMSSDEEIQDFHNGTRSASPVSKEKDSKFSFSLKREKSKSSSFLHSKKGKERKKLSLVDVQHDGPVIMKPANSSDLLTKTADDASGKRVGIRSMAIDGTIRRNFIVIHPSDESDTIGLAPLTQLMSNKEVAVGSTPRALSSVKSHITDVKLDKLEVLKKVSCQGDLKEELSFLPGHSNSTRNSKNYSRFDRISRSLRLKDKTVDHKTLGSSKSLPSDPSVSGISELPLKAPSVLSEVDCDSANIPTQKVHVKSNTTVSTLCVVQ